MPSIGQDCHGPPALLSTREDKSAYSRFPRPRDTRVEGLCRARLRERFGPEFVPAMKPSSTTPIAART